MPAPAHPRLAARLAVDARPRYIIAAEARLSPNTLSGIVTGRVTPTPPQRERIAAALETPVVELFEVAE